MKRSFLTIFDNAPVTFDTPIASFQDPRKKLKKSLSIDIAEAFGDMPSPFLPLSITNANSLKISLTLSPSFQTCSTPRASERRFVALESNLYLSDNDSLYDDFYHEGDAFNLTMKKCNRRRMEDRVTCESSLNSLGVQTHFFGIYDGHRNSYVSEFLQKNLHNVVQSSSKILSQPQNAIKEAFCKIDKEVLKNQESLNIQGGSTALLGYINSNSLYLANVGDSKAIVIRDGVPVTLNVEHRANNEDERKSVENRGGFIFEKKGLKTSRFLVQGALELTRSIGDSNYKEFITCEPDVYEYNLDSKDQYIIMASDGFWNEMNEEETVKLINNNKKSQSLSKALVAEAMKKRTYNVDNISLIVVDVQQLLKGELNNVAVESN